MFNSLFAPLQGLTQDESKGGNVRQFTGDGTAFLKVPGLVNVEGVRVGPVEIPLTVEHKFKDSSHQDEYVRASWPMIAVEKDSDGTPILLRSQQSNDGIWQKDAVILITGEWEPEKKTAGKPEKADKTSTATATSASPSGESNPAAGSE